VTILRRVPGFVVWFAKGVIRRTLRLAKALYVNLIKLPVVGALLQGTWRMVKGIVRA
jgi:hypothetical protein